MDLSPEFPITEVKCTDDFIVRIDNVIHGWMDMSITAAGTTFSYSPSYLRDSLRHLLQMVLLMLDIEPLPYNDYVEENNHGFYKVVFDLEGDIIWWQFCKDGDNFQLFVWKNPIEIMIESLFYGDYMGYPLDYFYVEHPEERIGNYLIFALTGKKEIMVDCILEMCAVYEMKYSPEDYRNGWGEDYPIRELELLKKWRKSVQ